MPIVELSHELAHGTETFPGFPPIEVSHHISFEESRPQIIEGKQFAIDLIRLIGGSGTYLDAPRHFDPEGPDIGDLPLERLLDVPIVVVPAPSDGRREYRPSDFYDLDLGGHAVLLATGSDARWGTAEYATASPYLGGDAARFLVAGGVRIVGIDAILIDDIADPDVRPAREAHANLLAASIPIIENMTGLTTLPRTGARLTAAPVRLHGVGSFPVRAFART